MLTSQLYQLFLQYPSVQTDTRKIKPGDIFFALKGDNFNGNTFAKIALENGAAYAVIDEEAYVINDKTILVNNALETLQALALYHRQQFTIPVIAITGSNGKTTTKELLHAVLSTRFITYTTEGNLNNHIGVPLTLLKIQPHAAMAVVEMGANHIGEIASYCQYTLPTHGLITNCGKAHLEGFGSIEGVKKAKGELYNFLKNNQGTAFINWDYDYLQTMSQGIPQIIKYSTTGVGVSGRLDADNAFLQCLVYNGKTLLGEIATKLVGAYNLPNVLAAVTIGLQFKISFDEIKQALENYSPSNSRSQLVLHNSNTVILDAYNANPSSMKLAIENFAHFPAENKIVMLGAMAELGDESVAEHENIIAQLEKNNWGKVVLVGGDFLKTKHSFLQFAHAHEAKEWFAAQHFQHYAVLIKGSRSMKMEKIVEE